MLYVVLVAVDSAHCERWVTWMREEHIGDVLATGCFEHATFVRDEDADSTTHAAYRVYYRAHSAEAFDRYQTEFGEQLRRDHTEQFGGVVEARRELLPVVHRQVGQRPAR